jgi:hypothetical protein
VAGVGHPQHRHPELTQARLELRLGVAQHSDEVPPLPLQPGEERARSRLVPVPHGHVLAVDGSGLEDLRQPQVDRRDAAGVRLGAAPLRVDDLAGGSHLVDTETEVAKGDGQVLHGSGA